LNNITYTSATKLARAIRRKQLSSVEVVDAYLRRIEAVNPKINAVVQLTAEAAKMAARKADAALAKGEVQGPLHGVPFTAKDALEVAGVVSSGGALGRANFVPNEDATVVARMKAAGGILLGKTNLTEACLGWESDNLVYGRANNPYDLSRTPGGSSGGEAAIVAAGGSPVGIGSDAGGSVRVPAHFCGLTSIKPNTGRTPRTGHWPKFNGVPDAFNQLGPLARHIEDLALVLPILCGPDWRDPHVVPMPLGDPGKVRVSGLRIAMYLDNGVRAAEPDTAVVVRSAAKALEAAGAHIEQQRPPHLEQCYELLFAIWGADGGENIREMFKSVGSTRTHRVVRGFREKQGSKAKSAGELARLLVRLDEVRSAMTAFMENYDALLCPTGAGPAAPHGTTWKPEQYLKFTYTSPFNITGWPAAVVRCGTSKEGLPITVQVAARPWREDVALALVARLERELGGFQPPPI
jgi:amidase